MTHNSFPHGLFWARCWLPKTNMSSQSLYHHDHYHHHHSHYHFYLQHHYYHHHHDHVIINIMTAFTITTMITNTTVITIITISIATSPSLTSPSLPRSPSPLSSHSRNLDSQSLGHCVTLPSQLFFTVFLLFEGSGREDCRYRELNGLGGAM